MVIVTVIVSDAVPSETVIVKESVAVSPASSAVVSASELSRVYVHEAPLRAIAPYVPVVAPEYVSVSPS